MKSLISAVVKYPVLAVASLIGVVAVGIGLYNWVKKRFFVPVVVDKSELPLHVSAYKGYADRLETAMGGTLDGTDEDAIFEIFRSLNPHEIREVYNAFGNRVYKTPVLSYNGDLIWWLKEELDDRDYKRVESFLKGAGLVN